MARTKLTPELHETFVNAVRAGTPIIFAAQYVGVTETCIYDWRKRGERYLVALEAGECEPDEHEERFAQFAQDFTRAQVESVVDAVQCVRDAMTGTPFARTVDGETVLVERDPDPKMAAWWLTHSPARGFFHRAQEIDVRAEVSGPEGGPIQVEHSDSDAIDITLILASAGVVGDVVVEADSRPTGAVASGNGSSPQPLHPPHANGEAEGVPEPGAEPTP